MKDKHLTVKMLFKCRSNKKFLFSREKWTKCLRRSSWILQNFITSLKSIKSMIYSVQSLIFLHEFSKDGLLTKSTEENIHQYFQSRQQKQIQVNPYLMLDLHLVFSCPTKGKRVGILSLREREMGLPKSKRKNPIIGKLIRQKNFLISYPKSPSKVFEMQTTPMTTPLSNKGQIQDVYGYPNCCQWIHISVIIKVPHIINRICHCRKKKKKKPRCIVFCILAIHQNISSNSHDQTIYKKSPLLYQSIKDKLGYIYFLSPFTALLLIFTKTISYPE